MSEQSGKEEQVKNPDRRKFLNRAVKLGIGSVGTVVLGGIVANEVVNKSEGNIVTESGIFFPLYETHDKGIKVEAIPQNLDVFFSEQNLEGQTFLYAPEDVLRRTANYSDREVSLFPNKILAFLSQEKTEIMLGDVRTPGIPKKDRMIVISEAGGALVLGLLFNRLRKINSETGIGRRKFLQAVMLAGAAWGLSKAPGSVARLLEPNNKNAIDRIYNRYFAIESHMHPELSMIFFRNIMMADKLLTVSEDVEKKSGQNANIAFNVGTGHSGIEDFLQAGHDFCRGLILAYPKWYLRQTVGLNNGIKDFCSARMFMLPENLTEGDAASGERLKETTERRVVDERLERALTLKLA